MSMLDRRYDRVALMDTFARGLLFFAAVNSHFSRLVQELSACQQRNPLFKGGKSCCWVIIGCRFLTTREQNGKILDIA